MRAAEALVLPVRASSGRALSPQAASRFPPVRIPPPIPCCSERDERSVSGFISVVRGRISAFLNGLSSCKAYGSLLRCPGFAGKGRSAVGLSERAFCRFPLAAPSSVFPRPDVRAVGRFFIPLPLRPVRAGCPRRPNRTPHEYPQVSDKTFGRPPRLRWPGSPTAAVSRRGGVISPPEYADPTGLSFPREAPLPVLPAAPALRRS